MSDICTEDKNLLAKAKAVFGDDLVTNAFVCIYEYSPTTQEETAARFAKELHSSGELEDGALNFDSQTIRIQFRTGRVVEFSNSEWAHMKRII